MPTRDYVIVGGGLAGLSLAWQLTQSSDRANSILVVDRDPNPLARHTWSYWTRQPTIFDPIVYHRWTDLQVSGPAGTRCLHLPGSRLEMLRGCDLNAFARRTLARRGRVAFQTGIVEQIEDGPLQATVIVDGQAVPAEWVFTSASGPVAGRANPGLTMQFWGWTIETQATALNPLRATFLDFRTPQTGSACFFYVLPVSRQRGLVQYVRISAARLATPQAEAALRQYATEVLRAGDYRILGREAGALALDPTIAPRRLGQRVMAIGAKAGLVKPSTGFGFQRIQRDARAVARSLRLTGEPWDVPAVSQRHRLYDALLLDVLAQRGNDAQAIFYALFTRNPLQRVLRFLDETTTPAEELQLIASLPPAPFLQAMSRRVLAGRAG